MPNNIRLLSPDLISKIAAGEVVERPASIVKELLENAVDSGADSIKLTVEKGGINYIEVKDNGIGMGEQDAKLSLVQHATSKVKSVDDLHNIHTLGFRGEALSSISSVSQTVIHTKTADSNPVLVTKNDEQIIIKQGDARNRGTTVVVKDVFQKIPARKKFLKSENTEYKNVLNTFLKIAMANYEITFEFINNNKLVFSLPKTISLEKRIIDIYPRLKSKLIPIQFDDINTSINGYIGHPSVNRSDPTEQYLFVNRRSISDSTIAKAVKVGFGTNLMHNQYPVFFLDIKLPTEKVDVNIHPRKTEVRFDDPGTIFRIINNSIRSALEQYLQGELKARFSSLKDNTEQPFGEVEYNTSSAQIINHDLPRPEKTTVQNSLLFTQNLLKPDGSGSSHNQSNTERNDFQVIQIMNTYLVTENETEMLVIDQHAAAERITFEKIITEFENDENLKSQPLLLPEQISLSEQDLQKLKSNLKSIRKLGFDLKFSGNAMSIIAVPEILANKPLLNIFQQILLDIEDYSKKEDSEILHKIIATLACHSSIRAGQRIGQEQARYFVINLLKCRQPYSCPHGRPIIWTLSKNELEKNFKRKL